MSLLRREAVFAFLLLISPAISLAGLSCGDCAATMAASTCAHAPTEQRASDMQHHEMTSHGMECCPTEPDEAPTSQVSFEDSCCIATLPVSPEAAMDRGPVPVPTSLSRAPALHAADPLVVDRGSSGLPPPLSITVELFTLHSTFLI